MITSYTHRLFLQTSFWAYFDTAVIYDIIQAISHILKYSLWPIQTIGAKNFMFFEDSEKRIEKLNLELKELRSKKSQKQVLP